MLHFSLGCRLCRWRWVNYSYGSWSIRLHWVWAEFTRNKSTKACFHRWTIYQITLWCIIFCSLRSAMFLAMIHWRVIIVLFR